MSSIPLTGQATTVYKWTDAQGVVHFSDQPVEGAERIVTSSGPGRNGILGQTEPSSPKPAADAKKQTFADFQLNISSPAAQQTFTGNEPVPVQLTVAPALRPGQTVRWTLNGAPIPNQAPDALELTLSDLDRGVYTIAATVSDPATGDTKSAPPVTFNVVRPSLLSPQHK